MSLIDSTESPIEQDEAWQIFVDLAVGISRGAFLALRGRCLEVAFRMPDGELRRFHMQGRGVLRFGAGAEPNPDATITIDFGGALHLSSPTTTLDDVRVAVDAGLVTVSGDVGLVGRIALVVLLAEEKGT